MDVLSYIGYIAGAFGIIAVIVSGYIVFRSSASKATIEVQEKNIRALFDTQAIQEREIQGLKERNDALQKELDVFKTVPLTQLVETQSDLTKLVGTIADNQKMIMQHLKVGEL